MKCWFIFVGLMLLVLATPKQIWAIEFNPLKCGLPQFLTEIQAFGCPGSVQCHGTGGTLSVCCASADDCPVGTIPDRRTSYIATPCAYLTTTRNQCLDCMDGKHIWTAIGCIPTDPSQFIAKLLQFGVGIAGGIAFLLIIFGGYQVLTSAGNPEQLNAGKELVGSAVAGLLLIIFSLFILQFIGYNVLGLPGFGK